MVVEGGRACPGGGVGVGLPRGGWWVEGLPWGAVWCGDRNLSRTRGIYWCDCSD